MDHCGVSGTSVASSNILPTLLKTMYVSELLYAHTSLKPGSQYYDAGAASVTSIVSVKGKGIFHQSNWIPDIKFFDSLIGWMLANTCDTTLE